MHVTKNARGEARSLETTRLRRSEKLIGAHYRNALTRRVQALGSAIGPTLVGRNPASEFAGFEWAPLEAFSRRRLKTLDWLQSNGLPYRAELAKKAAPFTRFRKKNTSLHDLIPIWR